MKKTAFLSFGVSQTLPFDIFNEKCDYVLLSIEQSTSFQYCLVTFGIYRLATYQNLDKSFIISLSIYFEMVKL